MWIDSSKWEHMKKTIIIYGILAILILAFGVIGGLRNTKSDDSGHWHTIFGIKVGFSRHGYSLVNEVLPTCLDDGQRDYVCTTCGWTKSERINAKCKGSASIITGHQYSDSGICMTCGFDSNQYRVGEKGPSGGYVFYDCDADNNWGNKDGLKSSECGWRFLEAAPSDLNWTYAWGDEGSIDTSEEIGTGKTNTGIIAIKNTYRTAARACLDYSENGYDDWFLPSYKELLQMDKNLYKKGLGGLATGFGVSYWSSSDYGGFIEFASRVKFGDSTTQYNFRFVEYNVRPVRYF